jgi:hypothetical protein
MVRSKLPQMVDTHADLSETARRIRNVASGIRRIPEAVRSARDAAAPGAGSILVWMMAFQEAFRMPIKDRHGVVVYLETNRSN